jgi:hypothetical protein
VLRVYTHIKIKTYIASASSCFGTNWENYLPFNITAGFGWISATNTYNAIGTYIGAVSTTSSGVSIAGEYIQLQLTYSLILSSYKVVSQILIPDLYASIFH